jgi:hypothetical protein
LYQVEYAIGAIGNSTGSVAVLCADGVVIAAEKKIASKLLAPPRSSEKMFALDEHVLVAVAGLTADANILLTQGRLVAQRHRYAHGGAAMAVEPLVATLADYKHSYTQYGGLRPFGCAFLYAGWDADRGFQLYQSDPSGNYSGWKATAIGNNAATCVRGGGGARARAASPAAAVPRHAAPLSLLSAGPCLRLRPSTSPAARSRRASCSPSRCALARGGETARCAPLPPSPPPMLPLPPQVLCKALDTAHPTSERLEAAVLHFVGGEAGAAAAASGASPPRGAKLAQTFLSNEEVDALITQAVPPAAAGAVAPGAAQASI